MPFFRHSYNVNMQALTLSSIDGVDWTTITPFYILSDLYFVNLSFQLCSNYKRLTCSCVHTLHTKHVKPQIYCYLSFESSMVSFWQKQASSKNVNILALKCTIWPDMYIPGLYQSWAMVVRKNGKPTVRMSVFEAHWSMSG